MTASTIIQKARIKLRCRTAAEWTSTNEILLEKELGIESDTGKDKLGDGVTPWNLLAYRSLGAGVTNLSIANRGASTLDVTSDTGTDATIPAATNTQAGLATAAQITRLEGTSSVGLAAGLAIALS